jgi:hypothetical protein
MVSKRKIVEASYTDCRKITRRNLTNPDSLKVLKKIKGLFGLYPAKPAWLRHHPLVLDFGCLGL